MNIIIVGQGSMGLLWYHHIQQLFENSSDYHRAQLHLLASNRECSHREPSKTNHGDQYSFTDHNNVAHKGAVNYANIDHIKQADVIILCVKSFQILPALQEIENNVKNDSAIILAHNGMGTLNELSEKIKNSHNIYALLTTHGCLRSSPLTITHTGIGSTDIGLLSGVTNIAQQHLLTDLLSSALPKVDYHNKIKYKQWLKLAINCIINPITAINNIKNGQVNDSAHLLTTKTLLEEVIIIAKTQGVILSLNQLTETVAQVAQATARNTSSMRCDILANRKSEIDYINGYIHRLGIQLDIATPENTKVWQTVKSLEAKQ